MTRSMLVLAASLLLMSPAMAQESDSEEREGKKRRPPAAALEACSAMVAGDPCAFEGRGGETMEGTCFAPEDKPLACRPDREERRKMVDVQ